MDTEGEMFDDTLVMLLEEAGSGVGVNGEGKGEGTEGWPPLLLVGSITNAVDKTFDFYDVNFAAVCFNEDLRMWDSKFTL